jgi:2-polyprenyl-3-methyl-5-hydroxy-6-metoxy-1,4-benzoquinol methylase
MSLTVTLPSAIKPLGVGDGCPVCGALDFTSIYDDVHDPITLDSFRVVECCACGVAFTMPRPASLDRYYPREYRAFGSLVTRVLSSLYDLRVSRWVRCQPKGASVLEVGCGPGLMLAAFHRRGWRVLGIERDERSAETARRALGLEIVAVPVEELPTDARFDLIIMFHVLEHIGDPVALLRECAKRLTPDGRLIVNVPNFLSWQSQFAGSKWLNLDTPRHLVHFTPLTLAETMKRAGLTVIEISFASLEHDPYGWVESTLNRLTGRSNTLTRFLMGLDPFGPAVLLSFVLGAALFPAALLLALMSWIAKRGGVMEAIAVASQP